LEATEYNKNNEYNDKWKEYQDDTFWEQV
jgi:hypothetical protein